MTRSIWRWSHLLLALLASFFLILASVSGFLLTLDPIQQIGKTNDNVPLQTTIDSLSNRYLEIFSVERDKFGFYNASVLNEDGDFETFRIDPETGNKIGEIYVQSKFFEWMTSFHRSLFWDKLGRFFVGLSATMLFFIAVSGIILVIQRSKSLKSLFDKIEKDEKTLRARFYHIVLGRLAFIPIAMISFTGSYLFLQRFQVLPIVEKPHSSVENTRSASKKKEVYDFNKTLLSEIQQIEFPFSPDEEDYFVVSTQTQEFTIHQYDYRILAQVDFPSNVVLSSWILDLHTATGRMGVWWAIVLAIASLSILYFIYSGLKMFFFSLKGRIKNKYSLLESEIVILVGSQNANTLILAKLVQRQLIQQAYKVHLTDLNAYKSPENVRHLLIFTSTYGIGEPPINANHFIKKWKLDPLSHSFSYSVVGFGSLAYPDFCQFAVEIDTLLKTYPNANQTLPLVKIHNQSYHSLKTWAIAWTQHSDYTLSLPTSIETKKLLLNTFTLIDKKTVAQQEDNETFTLQLQTKQKLSFRSGDLLAVYPPSDPYERWYSIGKIAKNQLIISVRKHAKGIGSNYLNDLKIGDKIEIGIKANDEFHYRENHVAIFIGNGTGMGAFLGMIAENRKQKPLYLYWGGRCQESYSLYREQLTQFEKQGKITQLNIAFSRPKKQYVGDLVRRDGHEIARLLKKGAIVYICGSLAMQQDVLHELESICKKTLKKSLNYFQKRRQIKMDCY